MTKKLTPEQKEKMDQITSQLERCLDVIAMVVPGFNITLVVRHPDHEKAEMVMGDDDLSQVIETLNRVINHRGEYVEGGYGDVH